MNEIALIAPVDLRPRTPCMLVLDVSGSRSRESSVSSDLRIDELNRGLTSLKRSLCKDDTASTRVQLAIVCVGSPLRGAELVVDWTDACRFEPPVLHEIGPTSLAQCMRLALHHVDRMRNSLRQSGIHCRRPWIVVISDGRPSRKTSEIWTRVAEECRAAEQGRRCVILPIAVDNENAAILQELSVTRVASMASARFGECFEWLSESLERVSRSRPGETVELPATEKWATFPSSHDHSDHVRIPARATVP